MSEYFTAKLDISQLEKGTYILNLSDGVDTSTHKIQLDEITKLGEKLIQKRIFFVNTYELLPKDLKEKNYFCTKKVDGFHYSDEVIKSISLIAADSLKKFLDSKF